MAHAFVKTSDGDARLIVMHQPAVRMEEYFRVTSKQSDQSYEARKRVPLRKSQIAQNGCVDNVNYAAIPNNFPMNFACPAGSSVATHLTLPFLTIAIASIPRKFRHAVHIEP